MAEADGAQVVLFSGYLDKESKNSKWNRRFFVLEPSSLRYYKDDPEKLPEEDRQSRGEIKIRRIFGVDETTVKDHKSCFEIQTQGGPIYLSANTDEERTSWIEHLREASKRYSSSSSETSGTTSKKDTSGYRTKVVGGVVVRIPINTDADTTEGGDDTGEVDRSHGAASNGAGGTPGPEAKKSLENLHPSSSHHRKDGTRVVKCGYAVKQGHVRKNWKRRFFLLDPFGFAYYNSEAEKEPIKNIPIQEIVGSSICETFSDRENVFQVVTSNRIYYVQCDSSEERNLWITAIQSEIHGAVKDNMGGRSSRRSMKF